MATVTALESFIGRLEKDELDKPRIEKHSQLGDSVFPGKVLKEGRSVSVVKGQMFSDNHPAVKAFPSMFGEVPLDHGQLQPPLPAAKAKK